MITEGLVHAGTAGGGDLSILTDGGWLGILPFDLRAAVETAAMLATTLEVGNRKGGRLPPWASWGAPIPSVQMIRSWSVWPRRLACGR